MSYATLANELIFRPSYESSWQSYPFDDDLDDSGELSYFAEPGHSLMEGRQDLQNYVKLNVRTKLKDLRPQECPNSNTIGNAINHVLRQAGIRNYIRVEERNLEFSTCWETVEAIYIPRESYETHVLPKMLNIAERITTLESQHKKSKIDYLDRNI